MGWLRKKGRQLRKGIKKLGRKIGKAFKSILKPFAKVFNKFGPLGSMAMMFILPGIGQMMSGWGASIFQGTSIFGKVGQLGQFAGNVVKHVGNAINFVATAPQKIFQTITGGIRAGWNSLLGRDPTGGTFLSGTPDTYTDTTGLVGKELIQAETANAAVKAAAPTSWWDSFTNDVRSKWGNNNLEGLNNAWDVSGAGKAKLDSFVGDFQKMGGEIKDVFTGDGRTGLTEEAAKELAAKDVNFDFDSFKKGTNKLYRLDRPGAIGNIRDVTSSIGDVTVPGVGDVGDVAWGTSAALGTYSTLAQYGVVGSDDPIRGSSGMGYAATDQLGSIHDQGPTIQPWSFDPNISVAQNNINAQNTWNNSLGLPQGFDPFATPGFGLTYEQWYQQQMTA